MRGLLLCEGDFTQHKWTSREKEGDLFEGTKIADNELTTGDHQVIYLVNLGYLQG